VGFKDWLIQKFAPPKTVTVEELIKDEDVQQAINELYLKELAFWTCVNKIANALSKCEFKTYYKDEEKKEKEWYRWNIEPNPNQNATAFINKLIGMLYRRNEALVVEINGALYIADSYQKERYALRDYEFKNVLIDDYTLSDAFYMSDVFFFELNSKDVKKYIDNMNASYSKLMSCAFKAYQKSRGSRGILNISAMAQQAQNFDETFEKLMSEHFANFFKKDNAVLPLFDGYSYQDISQNSKTYSTENTRDIKALADDIFEFTARAFSFPPSLAKGDVQDTSKAVDELLTFVIDPLAKMITQEINRKEGGYINFSQGNYVRIDTTTVKHIDIFDIATPIDKLISCGAFSVNDILELLGKQRIDEDWANKHIITKNYANVEDVLDAMIETGGNIGT
jgi:HK97 family phage portal protein